jgi:hypothetical protein
MLDQTHRGPFGRYYGLRASAFLRFSSSPRYFRQRDPLGDDISGEGTLYPSIL